jgi:hypothetical protein
LTLLAAVGLVLGCAGALYSLVNARMMLEGRDRYVATYREAAERQLPATTEGISREELGRLFESVAEAVYARRGVALSLAAMDLILSLLLFAGCARAMRGQLWGLSAWSLAAAASIPYALVDTAYSMMKTRDVAVVVEGAGKLGDLGRAWLSLQTMGTLLAMSLQILYFGACLLYLRRPSVRQLFR